MPRLARCAAVVCCLAFVFAACGGDDDDSKSAEPTTVADATTTTVAATTTPTTAAALNACEVVTQQQAEAILQTKLLEGLHTSNADDDTCTYPGDPTGPTAQFEIFIGAGAKKFYDDDATVLQHPFTDLPGVGDEAHQEDYAIFFRKGDTWVALRVTSLDDYSKFKPALEALAKDVATKV